MDKFEFLLIGLFKVILVLAVCAALVFCGWSVVKGAASLSAAPANPPARITAPEIKFDQGELLRSLTPQAPTSTASAEAGRAQAAAPVPQSPQDTQIDALWALVVPYQKACGTAPLTKEQFVEGLRQTTFGVALLRRGEEYARSQLKFADESLRNPEVITLCKSGKTGIFLTVLEQHRLMWDRNQEMRKRFDAEQADAERRFIRQEGDRVEAEKTAGYRYLTLAATAFGGFMALVLVLIFARIESNLRNLGTARASGPA